jgi:hypothetical protein
VVGFVQLGKDQVRTRLTFSAWKKKAHVWLQERNEPEDELDLLQFFYESCKLICRKAREKLLKFRESKMRKREQEDRMQNTL